MDAMTEALVEEQHLISWSARRCLVGALPLTSVRRMSGCLMTPATKMCVSRYASVLFRVKTGLLDLERSCRQRRGRRQRSV